MTRNERQEKVTSLVRSIFGEAASTLEERATRFLEEAVELVQASGLSHKQASHVLEYVYMKPVGELRQEIGGVGLCLLAYCGAAGFSADEEEKREVERVSSIDPEHFRERHNRKADAGIAVRVHHETQ